MSVKEISEASGKAILNQHFNQFVAKNQFVSVNEQTSFIQLINENSWLKTSSLVAKPDQLIRNQGELGLIYSNKSIEEIEQWIQKQMNREIKVGRATGRLKRFIIEPFIAHTINEEVYISICSHRTGDTIAFCNQSLRTDTASTLHLNVDIDCIPTDSEIKQKLLINVTKDQSEKLIPFISELYKIYVNLHFTYLQIDPLVITKNDIHILDLSAKLDATAHFVCKSAWGTVEFLAPFGRDLHPEEQYIANLDEKSGASLKLTILNKRGRIWTMVAGGGASVIYADTICQMGGTNELANYGEYSGAPSEQQTYEYAKTILGLMVSTKLKENKILIIGGCIANFTNVAATFKGIVTALKEFQAQLIEHKVSIFVRRAGPNYQEGLRIMRELGNTLGVPMHVFGPETHMTSVVAMAMGKQQIPNLPEPEATTANFLIDDHQDSNSANDPSTNPGIELSNQSRSAEQNLRMDREEKPLFTSQTRAIVWGMQTRAVQSMLDFDYVCSRKQRSVCALVYPFTANDYKHRFYWGQREILIPVYKDVSNAMTNHPDADVLINFASLRSAYESTMKILEFPQIRTVAIIAEGIPENFSRKMIKKTKEKKVTMIGASTVGGIKPGAFKIGNTGGMMDNILLSKLYRPGNVSYVSRSGGMSNELNNIIARASNGVCEGIAIGGDRYPGTTFLDHLLRYEKDSNCKMMVLLGEVGGIEEYEVIDAIKQGKLTKPLIAWCIGTCASLFTSEVQFGHAGACARNERETAVMKNKCLAEAGVHVPDSFDDLGQVIKQIYDDLVSNGYIVPSVEKAPPTVPMDYNWARELGLIRKPASFMTSICDERGNELMYAGIPITSVIKEDLGIGGTLALLWFQRRLPTYANKFLEMCLMVTADHGPAVSGAHNTIVCARAGKDLVSSLVSGLLTIGDRFGGALDGAARQFSKAYDSGLNPHEFVNQMRIEGKLIPGIGHRVKSLNNPDMRVKLMKEYVKESFPQTPLLDFALEVEKITTSKKPNLIINVDGVIGVATVDLLRHSGLFTNEEAQEYIEIGALNGMFVLGRTIGFIGHYLDQKRLKQGLYRHPWDDISYVLPETQK